ncbi:MAG: STAS/SEC14 domain-containing protein [Anaerolineales bacterium]|nr:STAS/SEC14 domain-containing protein [Anaerolineales bacterium]
MDTVRVEAQVTPKDLLNAVSQLSAGDLEQFAEEVAKLRAKRRAPNLSQRETELMLLINQGFAPGFRQRISTLQEKLQAETLTPDEHQEYLRLIAQVEERQAQRLEALAELARLQKTNVRNVMKQLGIQSPGYV